MDWDWNWFVAPGSAPWVLPLVLVMGGLLMWRCPEARGAVWRWWSAVAAGVALVAASKIGFYGWGLGVRAWNLTCFSGHTVLGLALWPVALALLVPPRRRAWRAMATLAGSIIALLIGVSRVALDLHPVSEVLAGALLGGAVAAVGLHALRRHWLAPDADTLVASLCCILIVATVLPGRRLPALPSEQWLASGAIVLSGRATPVDRRQWASAAAPAPPATTPDLLP